MRSVMETVLRDHYSAEGNDLSEQINSVRKILPAHANEAALHRLRKIANAVLHGRSDGGDEKEMVSLLLVLRALIEGVPQWRGR